MEKIMTKQIPTVIEADEDFCEDCEGTGYVDYDMGGGNTRKGYCDCPAGTERMAHDEALRDDYWDRKIHERMDK